jgi:hypothetical protein
VDYWIVLYESRWPRARAGTPQRTMAALYALLDERPRHQPFTLRDLASRADVGLATAARVVERMQTLGLLTLEGGQWQKGMVGREPLRYRAHWPPRPTREADGQATGWADPG